MRFDARFDLLAKLERMSEESFDLVLLDVLMPELDCVETLVRIKSYVAVPDIPVIMISALDEVDSVIRGCAWGVGWPRVLLFMRGHFCYPRSSRQSAWRALGSVGFKRFKPPDTHLKNPLWHSPT